MTEEYSDKKKGIHASDVFTLQYFLLSIIISPIAYTKYKQYAGSGYKDSLAKNSYLKYLATFFSCSLIFSLFLGFVVKDTQKTVLVSLNTLLMMTILFSGLSEKNMKPFTTTLSINLCFSIISFIFYIIKIYQANPTSATSLKDGVQAVGKGSFSLLKSAGEGIKSAVESDTAKKFAQNVSRPFTEKNMKKNYQGTGNAMERTGLYRNTKQAVQNAAELSKTVFNNTGDAIITGANKAGQLGTALVNTTADTVSTIAQNVRRPFTKQNMQNNYKDTGNALKNTGVAKELYTLNNTIQKNKQIVNQNIGKAFNQKNKQNFNNLVTATRNTNAAKMFGIKPSDNNLSGKNQQIRHTIANSD